MTAVMAEKDLYLSQFSQFEQSLKDPGPDWLQKLRHAAIERFAALGFPTLDDEEWRFTPLAALGKEAFAQADATAGRQSIRWHYPGTLPEGVVLGSLADALVKQRRLLQNRLAKYADFEEQAFSALNTAFLQDGVFLYLPRNCLLEEPVELRFTARQLAQPTVWQRRCLIIAEANSQARVVDRFQGQAGTYFTNAVTEVILGEGALVDYYKVQEESSQAFHVHTLQVQQGRSSNFSAHSVTLGGRLTRNDVNAVLADEGCACTLNGLYLGTGQQLIDNHTRIEHARPHCASHELYKGILDGQAHGVFSGKIHVHPDAQKTDAKQTNQTLLLSDDATINTKPQLEIYADDVKCTHGATVGQLDTEAIFYLQTRGIAKEEAKRLLTFAFANDIIGRIKIDSLREELEGLLLKLQRKRS